MFQIAVIAGAASRRPGIQVPAKPLDSGLCQNDEILHNVILRRPPYNLLLGIPSPADEESHVSDSTVSPFAPPDLTDTNHI
jgi:hypothetical protein